MSLKAGIYSYLAASTPIAAVVSTRIWPRLIPQATTYPAISFMVVSAEHVHSMGGSSELAFKRVQVDCWADTESAADDLRELVRNRMDGYAGNMGSVEVQSCLITNERDTMEAAPGNEEDRKYVASTDFMVSYYESAPTFA